MGIQTIAKVAESMPSFFDEFLSPWNGWFDNGGLPGRSLKVPAVNITEKKDNFLISLAAPGLQKSDFDIAIDGNILTISSEKEEKTEEKEAKYTRKEYSYSSFERCFTMPDDVSKEKIDARYEDGVLKIELPKKEAAKNVEFSKHISIK